MFFKFAKDHEWAEWVLFEVLTHHHKLSCFHPCQGSWHDFVCCSCWRLCAAWFSWLNNQPLHWCGGTHILFGWKRLAVYFFLGWKHHCQPLRFMMEYHHKFEKDGSWVWSTLTVKYQLVKTPCLPSPMGAYGHQSRKPTQTVGTWWGSHWGQLCEHMCFRCPMHPVFQRW